MLLLALSSGDSQPFGRSTAVKAKRKRRFTYTNINVRQQQKHTKRVILCILLFSTKSTKLDFVCSSFKEVQIQKMSNFSIYLQPTSVPSLTYKNIDTSETKRRNTLPSHRFHETHFQASGLVTADSFDFFPFSYITFASQETKE